MSTPKRTRRRQTEASPPPASKRQKLVNPKSGLGFLVDENARAGRKLDAKLTNGVPSTKHTRVDESHALVSAGAQDGDGGSGGPPAAEVIDISSADEEDGDSDDANEEHNHDAATNGRALVLTNGHDADAMEGVVAAAAEDDDDDDEPGTQGEEMSFGDMLQAKHPEPIDVQASFADPSTQRSALIPTGGSRTLAAPSTTSLGTVLTQALKTNDRDLLESCFQVTDLPSVRSTVQRLSSQHVVTLLQRLAERIHKSPGRAGVLMVWVQWSLVAHGGYLASQPEIMRKLKSVTQVVRERARGLEPMLHLKGKMDMLGAQLELRKSVLASSRASDEQDDGDAVLYIEGQDDDDDDWSEDGVAGVASSKVPRKVKKLAAAAASVSEEEEEEEEEGDSDDESEEDDEDGDEDLIDIEAEETSDDDGDGAEDEDEDEEADSDAEEDDVDDLSEDDGDEDDEDEDGQVSIKQAQPKLLHRKR